MQKQCSLALGLTKLFNQKCSLYCRLSITQACTENNNNKNNNNNNNNNNNYNNSNDNDNNNNYNIDKILKKSLFNTHKKYPCTKN